MKNFIFAAVFTVVLGAGVCCRSEDSVQNTKPLADVKKEIQDGKAILIDVRNQNEWDAGHVKDAKFLPLPALKNGQADLSNLPKDKPIYTYCVMGKRALAAAQILKEKGYQATSLKEGYSDLSKNGFETTK